MRVSGQQTRPAGSTTSPRQLLSSISVPLLAALTETFTVRFALRTAEDPKARVDGAAAIEACGALAKALAVAFALAETEAIERMALERATIEQADIWTVLNELMRYRSER